MRRRNEVGARVMPNPTYGCREVQLVQKLRVETWQPWCLNQIVHHWQMRWALPDVWRLSDCHENGRRRGRHASQSSVGGRRAWEGSQLPSRRCGQQLPGNRWTDSDRVYRGPEGWYLSSIWALL